MSTVTETVQDRTDYAHPEVLVSTDWVLEHHADPGVKLVEVDVDTQAYHAGHIPGAVGLDWEKELQDQTRRDIAGKAQLEKLLGERGISRDDTIVLYGDHSNWFAAYAFWLCKTYGHEDVRLMNGGRNKWLDEDDKPLTTDAPQITPTLSPIRTTPGVSMPNCTAAPMAVDASAMIEATDRSISPEMISSAMVVTFSAPVTDLTNPSQVSER